MNIERLIYQIALTLVPGVGDKTAKSLIAHCGNAKAVFEENGRALRKIPGIGKKGVENILSQKALHRAEKELDFISAHNIQVKSYLDTDYPKHLKLCEDGPILLYQKGDFSFNDHHVIAVVGTRNATEYGKGFCTEFARDLSEFNVILLSGLAYGIDITAHKAALKYSIPTVGVLAHGLDRVYPSLHKPVAEKMMDARGGLITEFLSETNPDRENFPKRNRIVAGCAEAVVVVEAAKKGGALITAEIAHSYNRDVFAVPGRHVDKYSEGCNHLIKTHKAALIKGVEDLKYLLGWEEKPKSPIQSELGFELSPLEKQIQQTLQSEKNKLELDLLCYKINLPVNKVIPTLMALELKGLVKSHPGKLFELLV